MRTYSFPEGFLWGAATSAHQVEGNNRHNDWWAWEQAGKVKEPSGLACDHYRRYTADFDLAVSLNHNAHRLSIEWSRVEPARGRFDEEALAHYRDVVRALRQRHLEPVVTLHHYTNPQWVAEAGGWTNPDVIDWFGRYTERVVKELSDSVRYWVTINEPMVYVHLHYVNGVGPPGARDFKQALRVIEHLIRAHAVSYHIVHRAARPGSDAPQVSIAKYFPELVPCRRWWPPDRLASAWTDQLFNTAFLEALTEGRWSVPGIARWTIREARSTLDYLGLNFYRRQFVRMGLRPDHWLGQTCGLEHHTCDVAERSDMGWDICPEAFTRILLRGARLGLPIFVTENGTWMADDARRWRFIARHLAAVAKAMERGARVIGYLYWSLLDNFEWADGYAPRFGLVEVDYRTQERRVRESARKYAEVCRTNRLTLEA